MKYRGISIIKRKDCNTWCARFRKNGKQFYVSAKTQQECYDKLKLVYKKQEKEELKKLKNTLIEKKPIEPAAMTLEEWYKKWLELYKQNVKEGTKVDYRVSLDHLSAIKNKPINKITAIDIIEQLNKIPGSRTKLKVYDFANMLYKKALINELVSKNPVDAIDKPKHKRINGKALSNQDEEKIEKTLIENGGDMFLVCLYQGLRKGEMLALTSDDIDLENRTLTINKGLDKRNNIGSTKNEYSIRVMPLFDKTIEILSKYKNKQGRIFNYTQRQCERIFLNLMKEFENHYTIHSLRHTFITKCQEAGVPLHIIQKWVGHNIGSKITNSVYTHAREIIEFENVNKINEFNKK